MLQFDGMRIEQGDFTLSADMVIPTGARVAVLGPSGGGKSTLLGAIAGFVPLAAGAIRHDGRDIGLLSPGARPLSILFQDHNLFPHLSVFDNVALGLRPSLRLDAAERARVAAALDRVGLAGMDARLPAALSGGQQSRVALARAFLRRRPLLLLDEPFAALGPALKADMLTLLRGLLDDTGTTLMMVSHDPDDARSVSESVVLVAEGRADPPVPVAEIFAAPPPALRRYLGVTGTQQ